MLDVTAIKGKGKCFIHVDGYNRLDSYLYDGLKAEKTYLDGWGKLPDVPKKITYPCTRGTNRRYEIKDKKYISDVFPAVIPYEENGTYDEAIFNMYDYKEDVKTVQEKVKANIEVIEIDSDLEMNSFSFPTSKTGYWERGVYNVTNSNVEHQTLDKIIFPEILLTERPGKISSADMYAITREHIKTHIDPMVAEITSDYDFCFEVKKKYPLYEPIPYSYTEQKSRRSRKIVKYGVHENKSVKVFSMTYSPRNYQGYPVIPELFGLNDRDLKAKVDEWLESVMECINHPVQVCPHCKGVGYIDQNGIPFLTNEDLK